MKKVKITYTTSATDSVAAMDEKMDTLSSEDQVTLVKTMRTLQLNGDLWLRHYHCEGGHLDLYYILDSDDAVTSFAPAKAIFESAPNFVSCTIDEMPFEDFAAFAAEHDGEETPRATKTVEMVDAFIAMQGGSE